MESIVKLIILAVLGITEIAVYLIFVGTFLPKKLLKPRFSLDQSRDRGLRKYVYPTGRGITYEPHPLMRHGIKSYILFTNDGYKYIKCRLVSGIHTIGYSVVMFNSKNQMIDIIDITQTGIRDCETEQVRLHEDTSYVNVVLISVNQKPQPQCGFLYYKVLNLCLYMGAVAVVSFLQMIVFKVGTDMLLGVLSDLVANADAYKVSVSDTILPSLFIGFFAGAMVCLRYATKGIRCIK